MFPKTTLRRHYSLDMSATTRFFTCRRSLLKKFPWKSVCRIFLLKPPTTHLMRPSVLGVCFCELLCHVNVYLSFFFVLGVKRLTFNSVFFNSLETKSGAVNPGERPSPFTFTQCLKSTICTLVKEDLREFPNPETPALKLVIIIFETPFPLPWESISQSFFVFSASRWNIGQTCCCTYYIWSLCIYSRCICMVFV